MSKRLKKYEDCNKDKSIQELCKHTKYIYNEDETARQCAVCFQLEFLGDIPDPKNEGEIIQDWVKHPKSEKLEGLLFQNPESGK